MNVLLIHQAFVSPSDAGGTRHYELARHLTREGHRFTVVASNLSYLTGRHIIEQKELVAEQNVDGIRVLRAYTYPSLHCSFVWRTVSFLSFMCTSVLAALRSGPVDLVFGTSPPMFQAVSAWAVAFLRHRPFLLEIRDLWPEFAIDMGVLKNRVLIVFSRWLERFLYARARHIVVNSPAYRDYLVGKGSPADKVDLVPNGVDPGMFDPQADGVAIRQELGLDNKFIVTYTGALGLANDIDTILVAADLLRDEPDIHFLLVGDGKERPRLEEQARILKLGNTTFTGPRAKSAIPEVLAASDACVATLQDIPMFRTTYPNKVFDYMAAGRPTILAIDGVIRQVVEAARGGIFIQPGDATALAGAIRTLNQDRQRGRLMGKNARNYVVEHFDRKLQAEHLLQIMQQMVSKKTW